MAPLIRACYNLPWSDAVEKHSDGSLRAREQPGSNLVNYAIEVYNSMLKINTFNYTMYGQECLESIARNSSDLSTYMESIATESDYMVAPVPTMVIRIAMITGYNVSEYRENLGDDEFPTALSNFLNFDWYIYSSLIFIFLLQMVLVVIWRVSQSHFKKKLSLRKVSAVFRRYIINRTSRFKIISLVNSLTVFFMGTIFVISYKTQSIIMKSPNILNSFEEVLTDPVALPLFYDLFVGVSQEFKNAVPGSLRSKLWDKANRMSHPDRFVLKRAGQLTNPYEIKRMNVQRYSNIVNLKSALFTTDLLAPLNKNYGCAFSRSFERWKLVKISAADEEETLTGIVIRKDYPFLKEVTGRIRRVVEADLLNRFFTVASQTAMSMAYFLQSYTSRERIEQEHLCKDNSIYIETAKDIPNLKFSFYFSFAKCIVYCLCFAFFSLLLEVAISFLLKRRKRTKSPAKKDMRRSRRVYGFVIIELPQDDFRN